MRIKSVLMEKLMPAFVVFVKNAKIRAGSVSLGIWQLGSLLIAGQVQKKKIAKSI